MTDIIEDAEHVLQRMIDVLEVFLDRLVVRLNTNIHRPLNRRTLLRWIAAFFPMTVNPRVKIMNDLGSESHMLSRWASYGSLRSMGSASSLNQMVEEDLGDNVVRYRLAGGNDDFDDTYSFMDGADWNPMTSTPNLNASLSSISSALDTEAHSKISQMEDELACLRKQIALLVVAQETTGINQTDIEGDKTDVNVSTLATVPLPESPLHSHSPNDSGCDTNRPLSCCSDETSEPPFSFPPVPPPPPPPPLPPTLFVSSSKVRAQVTKDVDTLLNKGQNRPKPQINIIKDNDSASVPKMCDVLKDLSNVKLKSIERSPGGTPFRQKPRVDPTDPASIIALALRKKFAHHQGFFSPDSDRENDTLFPSPDQITPTNSRTSKRRLSLHPPGDCSESWTPTNSHKPVNV